MISEMTDDFKWGISTSAYQIEGGYQEDGKGQSIWDVFTENKDNIVDGSDGKVACNHYELYKDDIDLIANLGIKYYRFSIAWTRIFPNNSYEINEKGIEFYIDLIKYMIQKGIEPLVCLHHWDLPYYLYEQGGWLNRECVEAFEKYAETVFIRLGKYVKHWTTFNQPYSIAYGGYVTGKRAPGKQDIPSAFKVIHNVLLAHGKAVGKFRELNIEGKIGIILNLMPVHCLSEEDEDVRQLEDEFRNKWFLDAVFMGTYPKMSRTFLEKEYNMDFNELMQAEDMKVISERLDFIGVNYYTRKIVRYNEECLFNVEYIDGSNDSTDDFREIYPNGLKEALGFIRKYDPQLDIYITENGADYRGDKVEDILNDEKRIEFLDCHFNTIKELIHDGFPIKGYYLWTLFDNFEWENGYVGKYGIVYVNRDTQERIVKNSGKWYTGYINENKRFW
ncbi:GH1 family beta-glucosidase [Vallitalea guaymasensis]|uniref:Beta-glucosidase n=1 Tax=Vallitalea guaymasensis TaxID=1185412 RepID=A0A8J8MCJ7_9FIRM|nr:GH1 family beta-glucosidase [Vallitalea guaymasensis]QUH30298.1 beta-glucosidase [Vallitalea guaymasensis]